MSTTPRILVVDDEPGIQRSTQRILQRRYHVRLAGSGDEALAILADEPYDLAVVDVRMPGMNGFELLKKIKAEHPDTEVIIMTGSVSNPEEKLVEALRERAFYFINKPFEKTVLETLVERCLDRQRLERENRDYTQVLEEDLERARRFQRILLPDWFPRLPGLRGDVWYEPSERLGGDFYDFFVLGESRFGMVLADVAGHGVQAALYTGMLKSEMGAVVDQWKRPDRLFRRLNDRFHPVTRNQFITAVLLVLDLETREARYVSAGHPNFLGSDGSSWESTGTPLGMLPGRDYEVGSLEVEPGMRLLFYTDGLLEALHPDGEEFGVDRLREAYDATHDMSPERALEAIMSKVKEFAGTETLDDDATALLLEYDPERT